MYNSKLVKKSWKVIGKVYYNKKATPYHKE
mgnify:CR=1 FL=1